MVCLSAYKGKWLVCLSAYLISPAGLIFVGRLWARASRFTHHTPCAALMAGAGRYGGNAAPCTPFYGWRQLLALAPISGKGLRPCLPVRTHTVEVLASRRVYLSR